jgi:hypothetical protein
MLGRDTYAHVHMVNQQMAFNDLRVFLTGQFVEYVFQVFPDFAINDFLAEFGNEDKVIFAIPTSMR